MDYAKVKSVSRALLDIGCYEVSLGDTVGTGNPTSIREMLETVMGGIGGRDHCRQLDIIPILDVGSSNLDIGCVSCKYG